MNLDISLFFSFIIFVILYFYFVQLRYTYFSSFFLSYMISLLILNIIYPPTSEKLNDINSSTSLYFLFEFVGFFLIIIYSLTMAINDYKVK